jgi:hypothetical protein
MVIQANWDRNRVPPACESQPCFLLKCRHTALWSRVAYVALVIKTQNTIFFCRV